MTPEIGHFAAIVAWIVAMIQAIVPLIGAQRRRFRLMSVARPAAYTQFAFLSLSLVALAYCFATNDFTVKYVANHSNSYLPIYYKISAVWGGHEGSLLLWAWVLSAWTAAVARFSQALPTAMVARVLGIMGLIATGFYAFLIFTSNPFERYLPHFPVDGNDLNPLLQDFGLIIHPPMLYMGYVGFSVAFAFALAGLLSGQLDSAWARWSRPWTTVAWCFLTLGIALGSWWAYYELGWGGWWFWDPVENASLMPWLAGTALMHSLAVTEKRGVFKAWTVLLAILAFSLSLLGTFLVRSGVLTSVHAFASDPTRGYFILLLLSIVVGGSLLIFAWRAQFLKRESNYDLVSREMSLLGNNILLIFATGVVLTGTLFPIVFDVFELGKVSIGAPYFNLYFVPASILMLFLMGAGPLLNWKKYRLQPLLKPSVLIGIVSLVLAIVFLLFSPWEFRWVVLLAVWSVFWVFAFSGWDLYLKTRNTKAGLWAGLRRLSLSYRGMVVAHIGVAMTVLGVALVASYDVERDVRLDSGQSVTIGGYDFVFHGVKDIVGPNFNSIQGDVEVLQGKAPVARLYPEKRTYFVQRNVMTEAAIHPGLFKDLYVALGEPIGDGSWAVRIYYKPFMRWVWLGAIVMALGGVMAISDKRYRIKVKRKLMSSRAGLSVGGA
ncbi:MAG: heme lyase NrfEFG subunit NrfE [Gammaproteobacteria bacterium]|nr:MAG: heme lyase NrfEFG subunit NrfE [Gammaproteobacteria bacterium]